MGQYVPTYNNNDDEAIVDDALCHGWKIAEKTGYIISPISFECTGWHAKYVNIVYKGSNFLVADWIYDSRIRRTGNRK